MVGDDEGGRALISELTKSGINNEGILIDAKRPTIDKTRIIAHNQQVVRIDKESDGQIDSKLTTEILSFAKKRISDIDAVIIEDYGKGLITPRLIRGLSVLCKVNKKTIMVDPKEEHFNFYKGVSAITPNRKEAEMASGIKIKNVDSLKKAGEKLLDNGNPES